MKVATLILNRNLPKITDRLFNIIKKKNNINNDIYIIESGSDKKNLSKNYSWWANWKSAKKKGLRPPRGFNYGLSKLINTNNFNKYDYFFLLTNDTEFKDEPFLDILVNELDNHSKVGIISPCASNWAEKEIIKKKKTKYFWYLQNTCYLFRKKFLMDVINFNKPNFKKCLYDGSNFRGYGSDLELISKGYINDWATALTTKTMCFENENYLKNNHINIKTESYEKNFSLYIKEGQKWARNKYGFNSRWQFLFYTKYLYNRFFEFYPNLKKYEI